GVAGERLLVRHRQHESPAGSVLQLEDDRQVVTPRRLPELRGSQHRSQHLLSADRVHLVADDLNDLLVYTPAKRRVGPYARADLADEASADEELVAGDLRVGGIVAQRRKEEL